MESPCHGCGGSLGRDGCREESENGAEGVLGWTKGELMGRERRRVRLLQVEVLRWKVARVSRENQER